MAAADVFEALAHPVRRRLLVLLTNGDASAGELAEHFPQSRPGISRHLRTLRDVGLVEVRVEAQRRVYRLRAEPLLELDRWLAGFRRFWKGRRPPI